MAGCSRSRHRWRPSHHDDGARHGALGAPSRARGPGDQSYLIGETIYLRGAQLSDAQWATAWRQTPFPVSAETAEEQLKKRVPGDSERHRALLIACRRDDGPALGAAGAGMQAEMLGLLVPWISGERFRPVVGLTTDAGLAPVVAAAEALGMRPAVRLRQGVWRDGAYHDKVFSEFLHPGWVAM